MSDDERHAYPPHETGPVSPASREFPDWPLAEAFAVVSLACVVLLGVIWVTASDVTDDPVWPGGRGAQLGRRADARSDVDRHPGVTRLQRCQDVAESLAVPLRAARPALDQWEVHVGAMNKLVVGAITLQQATTFWSQTRAGAQERIADFRTAERTPRREDATCPVAAFRPRAPAALSACLRQVQAGRRALEAARTAISTWQMHVRAMEALRSGRLSPTAATRMWLSMWRRGVAELRTFRAADRAAQRETGCRPPGLASG